ncbi:MAG: hypothetical protein Kilf2KO_02890 [Rhodospirillales bacterium]
MDRPTRGIDHIVIAVKDLEEAGARYERLGFTLTPPAQHPWGTANRLALFTGRCFLELLAVDRPEVLARHSEALAPRSFDFGRFNQNFLKQGQGASMLVLTGNDSRADAAAYANLGGHPPFDFERQATLPDGSSARVAFSLAFASDPGLPDCGFFTCHNQEPKTFWKPQFQVHPNGAQTIAALVMAAPDPAAHSAFLSTFTGSPAEAAPGGLAFRLGAQELLVVEPAEIPRLFEGETVTREGTHLFGLQMMSDKPGPAVTSSDEACGLAMAWRRP